MSKKEATKTIAVRVRSHRLAQMACGLSGITMLELASDALEKAAAPILKRHNVKESEK